MNENAITVPVRDINTIASEIRYIQGDVQQYAAQGALKIGERLCEAKELLDHGEFLPWLKEEFGWTDRTAQKLMAVYREFGDSQKSLFGPGINTKTYSDLPVSKLYLLISVPESEREDFVRDNNIEEISVREMEKLIKEKKEAEENAREATEQLEEMNDKVAALQTELRQLRNEDEENAERRAAEIEKARGEGKAAADKAWAKEINTAKLNIKEVEAARKKAEAELEEVRAEAEKLKSSPADDAALKEIEEKYKEQLREAERKLKLSEPSMAIFKIHFDAVQKEFAAMQECINKMEEETAVKMRTATTTVLRKMLEEVGE